MRLQSPLLLGVVFLIGLLIGVIPLAQTRNQPTPPVTPTAPQDKKIILRQQLNTLMAAIRDVEKTTPALLLQEMPANSPVGLQKAVRDLQKATRKTCEIIPGMKRLIQRLLEDRGTPQDLIEFQSVAKTLIDYVSDFQIKKGVFDREMLAYGAQIKAAEAEVEAKNARTQNGLGVTMSAYEKIYDGMNKREVDEIVGGYFGIHGKESSSAGSLVTYTWTDGFRIIVATFNDDKLVAKSQGGL